MFRPSYVRAILRARSPATGTRQVSPRQAFTSRYSHSSTAANQMTLPIRAVHGWGYMFAADITLDLDFRVTGEESRQEAQDDWRRETADASASN